VSYDLHFLPNPRLTEAAFLAYFRDRPRYRVEGRQAWYENEDTGVYFSFDWADEAIDDRDDDGRVRYAAAFNLNYFRPSFFGLEAEPEVRAFVERFDVAVDDPQADGMGEGPYSREGFLRGWTYGNRTAVQSIVREHGRDAVRTLPDAELRRTWSWNLERTAYQAAMAAAVFVPRIVFVHLGGRVRSMVVWPDGIPVALPRVDFVLVIRKRLAPRRLWLRRADAPIVPWERIRPLLGAFDTGDRTKLEHWVLRYDARRPPRDVAAWVSEQEISEDTETNVGVPVDGLVAEELLRASVPPAALLLH
jgi:hypothetical protein